MLNRESCHAMCWKVSGVLKVKRSTFPLFICSCVTKNHMCTEETYMYVRAGLFSSNYRWCSWFLKLQLCKVKPATEQTPAMKRVRIAPLCFPFMSDIRKWDLKAFNDFNDWALSFRVKTEKKVHWSSQLLSEETGKQVRTEPGDNDDDYDVN